MYLSNIAPSKLQRLYSIIYVVYKQTSSYFLVFSKGKIILKYEFYKCLAFHLIAIFKPNFATQLLIWMQITTMQLNYLKKTGLVMDNN